MKKDNTFLWWLVNILTVVIINMLYWCPLWTITLYEEYSMTTVIIAVVFELQLLIYCIIRYFLLRQYNRTREIFMFFGGLSLVSFFCMWYLRELPDDIGQDYLFFLISFLCLWISFGISFFMENVNETKKKSKSMNFIFGFLSALILNRLYWGTVLLVGMSGWGGVIIVITQISGFYLFGGVFYPDKWIEKFEEGFFLGVPLLSFLEMVAANFYWDSGWALDFGYIFQFIPHMFLWIVLYFAYSILKERKKL